ncbi:MAG: site-specific integrase [Chloroflexota bacterium]
MIDLLKQAKADHKNQDGLPIGPKQTKGEYFAGWLRDIAGARLRASTLHGYAEVVRLHDDADRPPQRRRPRAAAAHRAQGDDGPRRRAGARPPARGPGRRAGGRSGCSRSPPACVKASCSACSGATSIGVSAASSRFGGEWHLTDVKTKASRRTLELSPFALDLLACHRARQAEQRLAAGPAWHDHELVFCNRHGEPLDGRDLTRDRFRPLLKRAGLPPIRFHDLRHTVASLLLDNDTHPKRVQELLGHSTIQITLDTYSHLIASRQALLSECLERTLRDGDQSPFPPIPPHREARTDV